MSLHRRDAKRDANEAAIVAALIAAGASVTPISAKGAPDLLVGYRWRTRLLEVKRAAGPRGGTSRGKLTDDQIAWRAAWQGEPPVIVRTPAEALAAIGLPATDSKEQG